jgi:hypothetical protein
MKNVIESDAVIKALELHVKEDIISFGSIKHKLVGLRLLPLKPT